MRRENPLRPASKEARLLKRLISAAQGGNRRAFGELYEQWVERVFRFCLKRTGDRELAADLTSEIFLKIWQKLPQFNGDSVQFNAWIYRIAQNTTGDYLRQKKLTPIPLEDLPEIAAETKDPFEAADTLFDRRLEEALKSLSEEFRRAIELRYLKDLSFGQVAQRMRKKESTVRVLVSRALKALRNKLAK